MRILFLLGSNFNLLVLNIQPQVVVNTNVLIRHPNESEESDYVAAPIEKQ